MINKDILGAWRCLAALGGCARHILLEEGALEVGTEDMMAMLDLIDDGGELAAVPAVQAGAEYRGNLVGGEPPQAGSNSCKS